MTNSRKTSTDGESGLGAVESAAPVVDGSATLAADSVLRRTDGDDLNAFLKDLVSKKKRRTYQLSILKEFFEDPLKFGVKEGAVPTSSTPDEIAQRKTALEYRRDLLQCVLEATEAEIELMKSAAPLSAEAAPDTSQKDAGADDETRT